MLPSTDDLCLISSTILPAHDAGGQQAQVGSSGAGEGLKSAPRSRSGKRIGLRRTWKAEGKKARMKIERKSSELRSELSYGIGFERLSV